MVQQIRLSRVRKRQHGELKIGLALQRVTPLAAKTRYAPAAHNGYGFCCQRTRHQG